jgi:hypothetical protein
MIYSLNEIEAEVKKAVRGAGLPWGLAEEGAKAARWLAAHGVDPLPALLDVLDRHAAGENIATAMTQAESGRWRAAAPICPILLGASLCDHARALTATGFSAGPVGRPLLVIPFAARAARAMRRPLCIHFADAEIRLSEHGEPMAKLAAADPADAEGLWCDAEEAGAAGTPIPGRMTAAPIGADGWSRLSAYVQRTYVPASERSRREGAGAGLIDND